MSKSAFDLGHQNSNIEGKIIASLERVSQAFKVLLWNESKRFTLSPIQVQVLVFLKYHSEEKRKISYLADEFNLTKATISETIKILEHKKLIKKIYAQKDTRSFVIDLTVEGENISNKTELFTQQIQVPIENLNLVDKEILLSSLLGVIHHLNKVGIITIQRMCFSCRFYKSNVNGQEHFCELLNQQLANSDLRIDCPEHILK